MNDYNLTCRINDNGELVIVGKDQWRDFLKQNKGKTLTGNFNIQDTEKNIGIMGYFWAVIIPEAQKGELMRGNRTNKKELAEELIEQFKPIGGNPYDSVTSAINFIQWCKQYCAENLDVFIHEINTLNSIK